MPQGSLLWKGGIRSREQLWSRIIQTIGWIVSREGGPVVVDAPEGEHPWVCPEWHGQVRRCRDQHVADRLPGSIV
jgi:hypothetical protein